MDDGTLGTGFFSRFTVAFDFEGHAMYLKPNARYSEAHLFDASGVAFLKDEGGYQVDFVLPDSPAYRAGIRKGDRLAEVDKVNAQVLTPVQLRDLMSHPGETRMLELLRDGKQLHIALTLEARL
jgi:S1-C subfamily serine protease